MEEMNIKKPFDWPVSQREANLENIYCAIVSFINEPTYKSKEILFSLVTQADLNEINNTGEVRYTKYEVALINSIYTYALALSCDSIKVYLYRFLALTASNHKMMYYIYKEMGIKISGMTSSLIIEEYLGLHPALRIFYLSYTKFNYENNQPLCDSIIEFVNDSVSEMENSEIETRGETIFTLAHSYILMIKDLSTCKSSKLFGVVSFTREELIKLFKLESKLIDLSNQKPYERPLRSVILLSIRNWIMRSRNDYNEGYFYKCISDENAELALSNHEVWMKKIEKLNDPREMQILTELIEENDWAEYDWAKNIQINIPKNHFVCSYTKTLPNESMKQEYGSNVFGYKNDRISDVLTPIELYNKHVLFGNVLFYDVIYSKDEAKKELKYLCNIIDLFSFDETQKIKFLNEIMQYWYLSFKDENWRNENERRYHIVLHGNRACLESRIDGDFYKCKTSLYLYPDFLFGSEKIKDTIRLNRQEKLKSISTKNYLFCNNCLQSDFDYNSLGTQEKCRICGSTDTSYIEVT